MRRLKLLTRSRNDNAGDGGGCGRFGSGWKNRLAVNWKWNLGDSVYTHWREFFARWQRCLFISTWRRNWQHHFTFWWKRWLYIRLYYDCLQSSDIFSFSKITFCLIKSNLSYLSNVRIPFWMPMKHIVTWCTEKLLIALIAFQFGRHRTAQLTFDAIDSFTVRCFDW